MNAIADRHDFSPPADRRWGRPLLLALVAHALLVAALTWGVRWQSDAVQPAVEAELWSRLPQQAAPRAVEPSAPPPEPRPDPTPPRPSPEPPRPAPPAPARAQADIALQEKKKAEEARRQQELALQRERERREAAQRERERERQAAERRAAQEKQRQEAARRADEQRREAQLAAERQKNLERMLGQAGASGGATARGTAQQSSGPSASYLGRIVASIKPNIVFTDAVSGNPRAEVEVRLLPDGTIASSRLTQSSGNRAWDDAVLRAVERTARLPRDENGRVPGTLVIGFRPQD